MKLGGYPRLWWRDGTHLDLPDKVSPLASEAFEERWRPMGARVEWLMSPRGRLDRVLPQTLERLAHNANVRSWVEHEKAPY